MAHIGVEEDDISLGILLVELGPDLTALDMQGGELARQRIDGRVWTCRITARQLRNDGRSILLISPPSIRPRAAASALKRRMR